MNIKDIALLKYENLNDGKIEYFRAKTIRTKKGDLKKIEVFLNDYSKGIISKYGNTDTKGINYIFSIVSENDTELMKHKKIKNFTRFINQNLKKLAKSIGITDEISSYWARHSFATSAIRKGASMEFVSEALSHSNMKTTQGYFSGFEDKDKLELMNSIMDF
jgi:integrase/recombinase XerD